MTIKNLAYLAMRLFALYLLATNIRVIYEIIDRMVKNEDLLSYSEVIGALGPFLVPTVLTLLLSILIWIKSDWLSEKIVGNYLNREEKLNFSFLEMLLGGLILIGINLLIISVIGLIVILADSISGDIFGNSLTISSCLKVLAELVIGFILTFKAKFVARLIASRAG